MKKTLLYLMMALLVPVVLSLGAAAQESGTDAGSGTAPAIEKTEGEKVDADTGVTGTRSDADSAVNKSETEGAAIESRKKTERKRKETRKQPERKTEEKKEEPVREEAAGADIDRESGDSLLMIDHEGITYNRIPGITLKKEDAGEGLVKVPDDSITGETKEKEKSGGIFGKKTKTIAGWAIVVFIFILFAVYSKTRSKKTRRNTVRTITKR